MDALISGRAGLALIVDGDQIASIHAAEPERAVARRPHELHFLVGEGRDFVRSGSQARIRKRDRRNLLRTGNFRLRRKASPYFEWLLDDEDTSKVRKLFLREPIEPLGRIRKGALGDDGT